MMSRIYRGAEFRIHIHASWYVYLILDHLASYRCVFVFTLYLAVAV